DGNKNRLREQDVHMIVDTFNKQLQTPKYSRTVTLKEIEENEYNLNIPRYIDSSESEDIHDLYAHLNGGIPLADVEALNEYWAVFDKLKHELFISGKKEGYFDTCIEPNFVKQTILDSHEFKTFKDEIIKMHLAWRAAHEKMLYALEKGCHPKQIIRELSE